MHVHPMQSAPPSKEEEPDSPVPPRIFRGARTWLVDRGDAVADTTPWPSLPSQDLQSVGDTEVQDSIHVSVHRTLSLKATSAVT